jgi:eukaryotic-like serine/threonine-protein kinase
MYSNGDILLNNKYRIETLIGRGAFGEVYHVTHLKLQQPRAIKVLSPKMPGVGNADLQRTFSRFDRAATTLVRLLHPISLWYLILAIVRAAPIC